MRRFIKRIGLWMGVPIMLLLGLYLFLDPFKTLHPFSYQYYDKLNRDYLSSELFMRNDSIYHYDSFIFGSSRCMGLNTYHWKKYLPSGSKQFLFQAWCETLTGMEQKLDYIDRNGNEINHVLMLFDVPGTFSEVQLSKEFAFIKHYRFSGQSQMLFQSCLFCGFVQMPSKWISSMMQCLDSGVDAFPADTVSNDWGYNNRHSDVNIQPTKDSLSNLSKKSKAAFLKQIEGKTDADLKVSEPLITEAFRIQLQHIKSIFDKHHTDYRIVITPAYCFTHPEINPLDLKVLQDIFGPDRVYDYSGKNEMTGDCYNFSDTEHFGLSVGWQIIEEIYHK